MMAQAVNKPLVKDACHFPNRLNDLNTLINGLDRCQKSLNDYLASKRNAFPRFFFISDDELLSILGTGVPVCVQEHMIKVTIGTSYLLIEEEGEIEFLFLIVLVDV